MAGTGLIVIYAQVKSFKLLRPEFLWENIKKEKSYRTTARKKRSNRGEKKRRKRKKKRNQGEEEEMEVGEKKF